MNTGLKIALLLLALGLTGCPGGGAGNSDNQSSAVTSAQDSGADQSASAENQAPVAEPTTPETGSDVSEPVDDTEPPAEDQEADDETVADNGDTSSGDEHAEANSEGTVLELEGLSLDISPDSYRLYYNSRTNAVLTPTWKEDEQTGIIHTTLAEDTRYFDEVAYFLDGQLVGIMRDRQESAGEYADFTNELERRYGPPSEKPPRWAMVTNFFFGYQPPGNGVIMKFWGNSHMRQVLYAARSNERGATSYVLCDADRFDAAAQAMQAPPPEE